eukprot:m.36045 g.36045  ORF g.36045 m.36045 type:complete len:263 (-) comp9955_c1_seq1:296-1084(-)
MPEAVVAKSGTSSMAQRKERVFLAHMAHQADRYEDMFRVLAALVKTGDVELSPSERNLFGTAIKMNTSPLRAAWRIVLSKVRAERVLRQTKHETAPSDDHASPSVQYLDQLETLLLERCSQTISLITQSILPITQTSHGRIFFQKMRADLTRYILEVSKPDDPSRTSLIDRAAADYHAAYRLAQSSMKPCDPSRLGLALNYTVFLFEIVGDVDRACKLNREAFQTGMEQLDSLHGREYDNATSTLQVLLQNLNLWLADTEDN